MTIVRLSDAEKSVAGRHKAAFSKAKKMLAIFGNNYRMEILMMLIFSEKGLTTTDLYIALRISQPETSNALADLQELGLIIDERDGKEIIHMLDEKRYNTLKKLAYNIVNF